MWWPIVAEAVIHNPGRRLLDHCWEGLGGEHVDDGLLANATATVEDTGGNHMDPLVVRLLYWLVYVLTAACSPAYRTIRTRGRRHPRLKRASSGASRSRVGAARVPRRRRRYRCPTTMARPVE